MFVSFAGMLVGPVFLFYVAFVKGQAVSGEALAFFVCVTIAFGIHYAVAVFEKAVITFCAIAEESGAADGPDAGPAEKRQAERKEEPQNPRRGR